MATLITGHLGFIGSYLSKKVEAVGIDVRSGLNLLTCDLPENIDTIYHLAAQSDVVSSWNDPLHDLDNIRLTARLVKQYPNAKIIYANSCASLNITSPYGFSKWASDVYLKTFHKNYVSLIFPNIYGEGSRSVVDIFKGKSIVNIYGDGEQTRDYVHISDIIEALLLAKEWYKGTYFIGRGKSITVNQLAGTRERIYLPKREESYKVEVWNSTPNWNPKIDVLEYLK